MLDEFLNQIHAIYPLSPELRNTLERETEFLELPKKHVILKEGQRSDHIFMVISGLLRSYYLKEGEEITSSLMPEGYLVVSPNSFYNRRAGYEFIETLEPCVVARLHYDQLQRIYREHLEFNYISRVLTEHYLNINERRMFMLRRQSAEEKYNYFMENHPDLLQRVPLKYICTYLGINFETLSRIRKRLSEKKL